MPEKQKAPFVVTRSPPLFAKPKREERTSCVGRRRRAAGASSCTALHMLACRARLAFRACLELTFFSGMVHGAPNFDGSSHSVRTPATLVEDCSLLHAWFPAGSGAAGWFRVAFHSIFYVSCAACSLGSPRARPDGSRGAAWRPIALIAHCSAVCALFWTGFWAPGSCGSTCVSHSRSRALGALTARPERVQSASRTVLVAPNGVPSLIVDRGLLYLSLSPSHLPFSLMHVLLQATLPSPLTSSLCFAFSRSIL